jgi:uridine kinase
MRKVCLLISGLLRSFSKHLLPFLKKLPEEYHIYISSPICDKDRFLNRLQINELFHTNSIKSIYFEDDEPVLQGITQREANTVYQWKRIQKLFEKVPNTYDIYIRCRPDILVEESVESFCQKIEATQKGILYIPKGFDIFDEKFLPNVDLKTCLNDQFAFGDYSVMKQYCSLYETIDIQKTPIISEQLLFTQVSTLVERIDLRYRLVLSECFTMAICGDSGAGKSYLSQLVKEVLPFDNTLVLETDRYHKWERGAKEYEETTHLHPEANHLEKMSEDAYKLSIGEDIYQVDYDHCSGKFTEPQEIKANPFVVFCGLHTLYKESMRDICNLKIYIDTDEELKHHWKIQRDSSKRGYTLEKIMKTIEKRETDYQTFVKPQKEFADVLFRFEPIDKKNLEEIRLVVEYKDKKTLYFEQEISKEEIQKRMEIPETIKIKDGFDGLIQSIVYKLVWKN